MTGLRTGCSSFKALAVILIVRLGGFVFMVISPADHMLCFRAFLLPPPAAMASAESYIKKLNAVACAINFKSFKSASFSFLLLTILKVIRVSEIYFSRLSFVLTSSVIMLISITFPNLNVIICKKKSLNCIPSRTFGSKF